MAKKTMNAKLAAVSLALGALLFACASTPKKSYEPFTLAGMVYDRSGTPVNGMEIRLGEAKSVLSDYSGRFGFADVIPGDYVVKTKKEGFEPYTATLSISSPSQVLYLSVLSITDLLDLAEDSMRGSKWEEADRMIDRALAVDPKDAEARYMSAAAKATPFREKRDPAEAIAILETLAREGFMDAPITGLLGDLKAESSK
jgi:hypothetical protein